MFIQRHDARLLANSFGTGPMTLLALGGWTGSGEMWHDVFGHLPHWRCISYDHRGSGASSHQGRITVRAMVDDLIAVADTMQVGRCVLAAESAGCGIALEAALLAPERFAGLVLVGAAWQRPAPGSQDGFIRNLRANYSATLRAFIDACLPEPQTEDLRRWGLQMLQKATPENAIELIECRAELTVQEHLARINLPALLIHGSADVIVPPASSQALAQLLPDAELHLLPGLGHVPLCTRPALVAQLIESRFVNAEVKRACAA